MLMPVIVAFGWAQFRGTLGDPDITGVVEAMMIPAIFLTIPTALIAFCVFVPGMWMVQRVFHGRTGRIANTLIGLALTAPATVAFVLGSRLTPGPTPSTLAQDIARIPTHPERFIPVLAVLALGGLTFGLTYRTPEPEPRNPGTSEPRTPQTK